MIHPQKPADFVPKITVSGCCIEHDGEVLLLLRSKVESNGETWGFPSVESLPLIHDLEGCLDLVYKA